MKLSPTTRHFLRVNRWVCSAGVGVLVVVVGVSLLFATFHNGMEYVRDNGVLKQTQLVSLPEVHNSSLVEPVYVGWIDIDLSTLPSEERKRAFVRMPLPLAARENDQIQALRKEMEQDASSKTIVAGYSVRSSGPKPLQQWHYIIPDSLIITQAALERGRGTSRFALEGNNLFGMRNYDDKVPGIVPAGATGFKVIRFGSLGDGVAAYMRNLNTHSAHKELRKAQAELRRDGKPVTGTPLTHWLTRFSEVPKIYGKLLREIIVREWLVPFDNVGIGADN